MKQVIIILFTIIGSILIFDIASYFIWPQDAWQRIRGYRVPPVEDAQASGGRVGYPKDYFVAHDRRGFDIGPHSRAHHQVDGVRYDIWANSLGCFDHEHDRLQDYIYLAGDSYAWGYAPFEKTFGAVLQSLNGRPVLKCGVGHTGQLHQIDKMRNIVSDLKATPSLILVLYSSGDVANDFSYPHSTVVDGWQVNNIWLSVDTGIVDRVEIDRAFINARIRKTLAKFDANRQSNQYLRLLYRYSATSHIIAALLVSTGKKRRIRSITFKGQRLVDLYWPTHKYATGEQVVYRNNPAAERNKQAIRQFRDFAAIVDAKILFVLIPPKERLENLNFYLEGSAFLKQRESSIWIST